VSWIPTPAVNVVCSNSTIAFFDDNTDRANVVFSNSTLSFFTEIDDNTDSNPQPV
jgi:hypothetical protein